MGKIKAAATKLIKAHRASLGASTLDKLRVLELVDEDTLKGAKAQRK